MKLQELGIHLPVLPTTSVGSLPKSDKLKRARSLFAKGKLPAGELRKLEDEETVFWLKKQEDIGLDVLVDGELYRGDMVEYFAEHIEGFELSGLVRSYGNRYYHKPIIKSMLRWTSPITVERWKFAQSNSTKPVKGMLTGPYTIMDWSFLEHYRTRKDATFALVEVVRKEIKALVDAGAKIIQVDEPAISTRADEVEWALDALRATTDGFNAYFITHMCYGEFAKIYDKMLKLPVDNLDIEMSNSNLGLLDCLKSRPFHKDISFGTVDVHNHSIEDVETVKSRIKRLLEIMPKEKIWIDPDCGLKTRSVQEAIDKLQVIVEATKKVRRELA